MMPTAEACVQVRSESKISKPDSLQPRRKGLDAVALFLCTGMMTSLGVAHASTSVLRMLACDIRA